MLPAERRAALGLAAIFALRMLGLFIVLPVFAVAAQNLTGGQDVAAVGLALGAYGLTQADYASRTPHAWQAGPQTTLLAQQLAAPR